MFFGRRLPYRSTHFRNMNLEITFYLSAAFLYKNLQHKRLLKNNNEEKSHRSCSVFILAQKKLSILIFTFPPLNVQDTVMPLSFPYPQNHVLVLPVTEKEGSSVWKQSEDAFCVTQTVVYIQSTTGNGALSLLPKDFFCLLCCWKEAGGCQLSSLISLRRKCLMYYIV